MKPKPDWTSISHSDKVEVLRPLLAAGLPFSEISTRFDNASRSAVVGFCHRYGLHAHNAFGFELPPNRVGYHSPQRRSSDPKEAARVNNATHPATRAIVDEINASGFYLYDIAHVSGVSISTLSNWRSGRRNARPAMAGFVREALARLQDNPALRLYADRPLRRVA